MTTTTTRNDPPPWGHSGKTLLRGFPNATPLELALLILVGVSLLGVISENAGPPLKQVPLSEATSPTNPRVYLDITINGKEEGRIVIELFETIVPKTVKNFQCLCTGEMGTGQSGKPLHYKGSVFHRVIPNFMCQGGDITNANGTGGDTIYGRRFPDEWEKGYIAHSVPFLLSCANSGPNTNGSQFFLTTVKTAWLDKKHVVFGQVESGTEVIKAMEAQGSSSGRPQAKIVIQDCGVVKSKST